MKNKKKEYIIRSYKGPRPLFNYFWKLTERLKLDDSDEDQRKLRKAYHRFIVHIYIGTKILKNRDKYFITEPMIPVSSDLIRNKIHRELRTRNLEQCKIINIKNHSHGLQGRTSRSREFKLSNTIFRRAIQLETDLFITNWKDLITKSKSPSLVDLFTGKNKYTRQRTETSLYSNSTKIYKIPNVIQQSIKHSLEPFPFNPHLVIPWVERIRAKADRSKKILLKIRCRLRKKHPKRNAKSLRRNKAYNNAFKEFKRANGLLSATVSSLTAILNQGIAKTKLKTSDNKEIWKYKTAYSIQEFGRVSEIHGGFQILSQVGKKYLMESVPLLFNYDLKNSQAFILLLEFKSCGINCKWLENYLDESNQTSSKEIHAAKIGITVACWKDCFYATVMGAVAKGRGAPYRSIYSEVQNKKRAKRLHGKFFKIISPLYKACEKWRHHILTSKKHTTRPYARKRWWTNACGMKFQKHVVIHNEDSVEIIDTNTGEILNGTKLPGVKRRLAAFLLQGREACYIHNLTILCKNKGIPVYKNEHDGLITGDEIPEYLQNEAALLAGIVGAKLEIKEICSDQKESSVNRYIDS